MLGIPLRFPFGLFERTISSLPPTMPPTTRLASRALPLLQAGRNSAFRPRNGQIRCNSTFKASPRGSSSAPWSTGRVSSLVLATGVAAFAIGFGIKSSRSLDPEYSRKNKFKAPRYANTKEMEIVCQFLPTLNGNAADHKSRPSKKSKA
jgi:hypothetical protein